MRKIIEHIDRRNWRTLDYFRILDNKRKVDAQSETLVQNIPVRIFIDFMLIYSCIRNSIQNMNSIHLKVFNDILWID